MGCEYGRDRRMDELKEELEELRVLVNTLLTIIMEGRWGPIGSASR